MEGDAVDGHEAVSWGLRAMRGDIFAQAKAHTTNGTRMQASVPTYLRIVGHFEEIGKEYFVK
jgi:hypothetical protein